MQLLSLLKNIINSKGLFASGGVTFLFRIGGLACNFLITFLITNYYGDKVFGNYSLAFTLAQATSLLAAMGLPNAMVSYIGLKPINDPFSQYIFKKGLQLIVPLTLVPLLFYFLLSDVIATGVFGNAGLAVYINIVAFTVPAMVLHEYILYLFIATGNFIKFNLFMFVVPNVILLILLFAVTNVPPHYTFLFYLISIVSVVAIEAFFAFKKTAAAEHDLLPAKKILMFAAPMMFSGLMLYLLNWTDIFLLGAMVSEEELGHYNLAYKIASLSMLVIISINVVITPRIAALYNSGDLSQLHKTVKQATHLIIILTLPLVVVIVSFADFLLSIFGENFTDAKTALIIISAGFLLNAVTGNVDQILNMTNNQRLLRNITIFGFLLNILLNIILIPGMGINGAAVASLATNVVFNATCVLYIKKKLGFYTFA